MRTQGSFGCDRRWSSRCCGAASAMPIGGLVARRAACRRRAVRWCGRHDGLAPARLRLSSGRHAILALRLALLSAVLGGGWLKVGGYNQPLHAGNPNLRAPSHAAGESDCPSTLRPPTATLIVLRVRQGASLRRRAAAGAQGVSLANG